MYVYNNGYCRTASSRRGRGIGRKFNRWGGSSLSIQTTAAVGLKKKLPTLSYFYPSFGRSLPIYYHIHARTCSYTHAHIHIHNTRNRYAESVITLTRRPVLHFENRVIFVDAAPRRSVLLL